MKTSMPKQNRAKRICFWIKTTDKVWYNQCWKVVTKYETKILCFPKILFFSEENLYSRVQEVCSNHRMASLLKKNIYILLFFLLTKSDSNCICRAKESVNGNIHDTVRSKKCDNYNKANRWSTTLLRHHSV